MRVKLTAKHPRPASAARAPVRAGARKPVKTPSGVAAERAERAERTEQRNAAASAPRSAARPGAGQGGGARSGKPPAPRSNAARAGEGAPRGERPASARGERPASARAERPTGARGDRSSGGADKPRGANYGASADRPRSTGGSASSPGAGKPRPSAARPPGPRPSTPRAAAEGRAESRPYARPAERGTERSSARPASRDGARPDHARGDSAARDHKPRTDRSKPAAAPAQPAHREVDETGMMRLSKRMSELGLCSRREADEWIEQGWVKVDGVKVDTLGAKVHAEQKIDIMPAARADQAKQVTILLHKPVGYVSGQPEDDHKPAAALINAANQWELDESGRRFHPFNLRALAPAGRLDIESTGLLVLTQDGRIAKQLIGEKTEIDKEYLVRVTYNGHATGVQTLFPQDQLQRLRFGLELDEEPLKPAEVEWLNGEQLRFVLREGKKRQIRRMCELVGLEVVGLKRIRIGQVVLGNLPPGQWRFLIPGEAF